MKEEEMNMRGKKNGWKLREKYRDEELSGKLK